MERIILFDIDRTLLDTRVMAETLDCLVIKVLGNPERSEFEKADGAYMKTLKKSIGFNPDEYVVSLANYFGSSKQDELLDIFYSDRYAHVYKDNVFPDVAPALIKLQKTFDMGIYSEGTLKFQRHKYESMGISRFFREDLVFIVKEKDNKQTLKSIPKDSIIVDDKRVICDYLTKHGYSTVWINRLDNEKAGKYQTICSLGELPFLI